MKLEDQVAIVTGAGRNIGEEISKILARNGAKVAVVDMDPRRGHKVAGEIVKAGGEAAGFVADVSSEPDVATLVTDIVAKWGRVDILVNNAAISDNQNILEITKDQWDKVLAVTLTGPFLMSQHAARAMVAGKRGGKIVNVGSTSGFFGRSRAPISRAPWRCSSPRTTSASTAWCPTRSARRSARTSSIRPVR